MFRSVCLSRRVLRPAVSAFLRPAFPKPIDHSRFYCSGSTPGFDAGALFNALQGNSDDPEYLKKDPLFQTRTEGKPGTKDYRVMVILSTPGLVDLQRASPYFAVPLYSREDENLIHMVCEVPKGTKEKMEVNFDDPDHAITQDLTDEGKLRVYKHGPMPYNYGMLPQTYEDPEYECERTGLYGDGDPLDVIEIGSQTLNIGEVVRIKPLGILGLIDQGEIDWKIIGINIKDDMAPHLEDINDVEEMKPGLLAQIREWFRVYKVAEGKEENTFALDGEYQDKEYAWSVIAECYERVFDILPRLFEEHERAEREQSGGDRPLRGRRPRVPYKY